MLAQPTASHFVNGAYLDDAKGAALPVIFPGTGEQIAALHEATPAVIEAALAAAKAAQGPWAALKPVERGRILRRAADIMRARNRAPPRHPAPFAFACAAACSSSAFLRRSSNSAFFFLCLPCFSITKFISLLCYRIIF